MERINTFNNDLDSIDTESAEEVILYISTLHIIDKEKRNQEPVFTCEGINQEVSLWTVYSQYVQVCRAKKIEPLSIESLSLSTVSEKAELAEAA